MRRMSRFPSFGVAIANIVYTEYVNTDSNVWILSLFLFLMGILFSMVKEEFNTENRTFLLFTITLISTFFTIISIFHLRSIAFVFVAIISFVSGFYAYALGQD